MQLTPLLRSRLERAHSGTHTPFGPSFPGHRGVWRAFGGSLPSRAHDVLSLASTPLRFSRRSGLWSGGDGLVVARYHKSVSDR